jgi:hypothetical protein
MMCNGSYIAFSLFLGINFYRRTNQNYSGTTLLMQSHAILKMLTLDCSDKQYCAQYDTTLRFLIKIDVLNAKFWRDKLHALSGKLNYFTQQET